MTFRQIFLLNGCLRTRDGVTILVIVAASHYKDIGASRCHESAD